MTETSTTARRSGSDTNASPEISHLLRWVRGMVAHLAAFSFAINLLVLSVPLFMIQVFDRVLASHSRETLAVLAIGTVVALTVMALLELVRGRILVRTGLRLEQDLGSELVAAERCGHVGDVARLRAFLSGPAVPMLLDLPWTPIFLLIVFLLHPLLGWIALAGAALLLAVAFIAERSSRRTANNENTDDEAIRRLSSAIAGEDGALAVFGAGQGLMRRWRELQAAGWGRQLSAADRAVLTGVVGRFLRLALQVALMAAAAHLVIANQITAGAMIAAAVVVGRAMAPLERAGELWRAAALARSSLTRLVHMPRLQAPGAGAAFDGDGDLVLEVRRVAVFPPHAREPVLAGIAFKVKGGEMLGVTGANGAGKSMLARVLVGFQAADQGRVLFAGREVTVGGAAGTGWPIGFIEQRVELLSGTVRDNIDRFGGAPWDAVREAARRADADERILALPCGYETVVGPGTAPLPAGLTQRIGLARAFFGGPRLLVLDEPYTHLDNKGVEVMMATLAAFRRQGAIIVVISQRPGVLAHCGRVLVLADGRGRLIRHRGKATLRLVTVGPDGSVVPVAAPAGSSRLAGGER